MLKENAPVHMIAKSRPEETIEEHTQHLLEGFQHFCGLYGKAFSEEELTLIALAAKYHDCGKCSLPFQKKMRNILKRPFSKEELALNKQVESVYREIGEDKIIPHGSLSPAFLPFKELRETFDETSLKILINAIFYHHNRSNFPNNTEIQRIVREDLHVRLPKTIDLQSIYCRFRFKEPPEIGDDEWVRFAVVKGMLNRLDYWASGDRRSDIEIEGSVEGKHIGDIVEGSICNKFVTLRDVQVFMREHRSENLVVTASTGVGKTEAALLWIGGDKAFYTLPLKVSINAIYERIVQEYHYPKEKIALLHSGALAYLLEKEDSDPMEKYFLTRKFSFPLTICTVDQLFTFVYKYYGCELLLATLKYSRLVIDEIQAYSPEIIGKLIYGLKLITVAGGKFAIITATMPPIFEHYMRKLKIPFQKPEQVYFSPFQHRHWIELINGDFDYDEIQQLGKVQKVLVICNTVGKAQHVYEAIVGIENVHLLHSRFIQGHKRALENEIIRFVEKDNHLAGIWISTQVVEASLDIDFDLLYTEMCTADSLLQRLGRCYRKREFMGNEPNVKIYHTGNGVGTEHKESVYDKELYDRSLQLLYPFSGGFFTEVDKMKYIDDVYSTEALKDSPFGKRIQKTIDDCAMMVPGVFEKETAYRQFRDISSVTVIPERIYTVQNMDGHMDELIEACRDNTKTYAERVIADQEIRENTINLSYDIRNRDKNRIAPHLNIYRTTLKYEFDEETFGGRGLLLGEQEFDNVW